MTNVHLSRADSVGIGAPETDNIEITPEMIEVGLHHLLSFNPYRGSDDERTVSEIFMSMLRVARSAM